jgi:hypothetical protein
VIVLLMRLVVVGLVIALDLGAALAAKGRLRARR